MSRLRPSRVLTLVWLKSCITEWTGITGGLADFCKLTSGIPQGSNLGPLLFILHVKGLPLCQLYSRPRMHADDITLTSVAEDVDTLQVKKNCNLKKLRRLKVNKLTLNVKKTYYMLIGGRPRHELLSDNSTVKEIVLIIYLFYFFKQMTSLFLLPCIHSMVDTVQKISVLTKTHREYQAAYTWHQVLTGIHKVLTSSLVSLRVT